MRKRYLYTSKSPTIIVVEYEGCSITYDSRNIHSPFKIAGSVSRLDILRGLVFNMEEKLLEKGISLIDKSQLKLIGRGF